MNYKLLIPIGIAVVGFGAYIAIPPKINRESVSTELNGALLKSKINIGGKMFETETITGTTSGKATAPKRIKIIYEGSVMNDLIQLKRFGQIIAQKKINYQTGELTDY